MSRDQDADLRQQLKPYHVPLPPRGQRSAVAEVYRLLTCPPDELDANQERLLPEVTNDAPKEARWFLTCSHVRHVDGSGIGSGTARPVPGLEGVLIHQCSTKRMYKSENKMTKGKKYLVAYTKKGYPDPAATTSFTLHHTSKAVLEIRPECHGDKATLYYSPNSRMLYLENAPVLLEAHSPDVGLQEGVRLHTQAAAMPPPQHHVMQEGGLTSAVPTEMQAMIPTQSQDLEEALSFLLSQPDSEAPGAAASGTPGGAGFAPEAGLPVQTITMPEGAAVGYDHWQQHHAASAEPQPVTKRVCVECTPLSSTPTSSAAPADLPPAAQFEWNPAANGHHQPASYTHFMQTQVGQFRSSVSMSPWPLPMSYAVLPQQHQAQVAAPSVLAHSNVLDVEIVHSAWYAGQTGNATHQQGDWVWNERENQGEGVPQPPHVVEYALCFVPDLTTLKHIICSGDCHTFKLAVCQGEPGAVWRRLQTWREKDCYRRSVLQLLLQQVQRHEEFDQDYYTQGGQAGMFPQHEQVGWPQLEMMRELRSRLGRVRWRQLMRQTNNTSCSAALHVAVRHAQKRGANGYAALRMLLEDATLADHARPTLGCYLVSHVAARSGDEVAAGLLLRHQVQLVDQLSTVEGQLLHGMGRQQLIKGMWWLRDDKHFSKLGPSVICKALAPWNLGLPDPGDGVLQGKRKVVEWDGLLADLGLEVVVVGRPL